MNLDKVITKSAATRAWRRSYHRSSPFRFSIAEMNISKTLNEMRLKFWRKKYLDGKQASKILLNHLGMPQLRTAYHSADLDTCRTILKSMKEEQKRLGLYMTEIEVIEDSVDELEKRLNRRVSGDHTTSFGSAIMKALSRV